MSFINRLQFWYASHCDGEWEHHHGINIDTLDNTGWSVSIDIPPVEAAGDAGARAGSSHDDPSSWYDWRVEDGRFLGVCGPLSLGVLIEAFFDVVGYNLETFVVDGEQSSSLEEFAMQFSQIVLRNARDWSGNLDALNDILRGGFGTPENGFAIVWEHSAVSRERLGYGETVRQLERRIDRCHPSNREHVRKELDDARRGRGRTVFDWIVEVIRAHGPGGERPEDGVLLILK